MRPPERAPSSDADRLAQSREKPPTANNPLPFSRGNSSERVEEANREVARGEENQNPPTLQPQPESQEARALPPSDDGFRRPPPQTTPQLRPSGSLGEALRNLQQYVQKETFNNPQGGLNQPGATIQFDTKGVEFGPWLRRFVAQVRRNWFIPQAAMTFHGHVVLQFNIHKDGTITDVSVLQPSDIEGFNTRRRRRHHRVEPDRAAAAGVSVGQGLLHGHLLLQRGSRPLMPTRTQQLGLLILLGALIVYVFVRVL